jgi:hypothetical protein
MSTLLLERPPVFAHDFERYPPDPSDRPADSNCAPERDGAHDRLTLDDLVTSAWEGLAVRATVSCPVCAGPMSSRSSETREDTPTGACLSCGSQLS